MLRELARKAENHGRLQEKLCRQAEGRSDRPEHSVCSRLPFYSHYSRSIPFLYGNAVSILYTCALLGFMRVFCRDILGICRTMREINFLDLVAGSEKVEEDRLVHALLAEFEMILVNRRFGAVSRRYIESGASGG